MYYEITVSDRDDDIVVWENVHRNDVRDVVVFAFQIKNLKLLTLKPQPEEVEEHA